MALQETALDAFGAGIGSLNVAPLGTVAHTKTNAFRREKLIDINDDVNIHNVAAELAAAVVEDAKSGTQVLFTQLQYDRAGETAIPVSSPVMEDMKRGNIVLYHKQNGTEHALVVTYLVA